MTKKREGAIKRSHSIRIILKLGNTNFDVVTCEEHMGQKMISQNVSSYLPFKTFFLFTTGLFQHSGTRSLVSLLPVRLISHTFFNGVSRGDPTH